MCWLHGLLDGSFNSSHSGRKPWILQHCRCLGTRSHVFPQASHDQLPEGRPSRVDQLERWLASYHGILDVLYGPATFQENADHDTTLCLLLVGYFSDQQLHHHHTHGEDVATGIPLSSLHCLRWHIARSAACATIILRCHCLRHTKVDEHRLGLCVVFSAQHDVGLLDIAVHHALLVHERERLETLPEDTSPPV